MSAQRFDRLLKTDALIYLTLLALPFLAFGPSLFHDFSPIDDWFLIIQNFAVHGITWEHLWMIFTTYDPELYIPLTFFTWQINYEISGLAPWSYHLFNVLLHGGNAVLLSLTLVQLHINRRVALLAGCIFAVHPLNTEAVVWIAGRKDLLSTFLYLLSIILYARFVRGHRWSYAGSLLTFLLALLAKAMAVTLPAVLILLDLLIERRRISLRLLVEKIPFALLSILFMIIATAGKERVIGSITPFETLLMAGRSTVFYIHKFFAPIRLSVFYTHRGPITMSDPHFWLPFTILLIIASAFLWVGWQQRKRALHGEKISSGFLLATFGALFFIATLAPTFLNFQKGAETFIAVDRYAYLPMLGLFAVVIAAGSFVYDRYLPKLHKKNFLIGTVLLTAIFTTLSFLQTRIWETPEKLYLQALSIHPESLGARISYVKLLRERGQLEAAFQILREGIPYGDDSHLHIAAGLVYAKSGQVQEAIAQFEIAKKMDPKNPEPHFSLGSLWEQTGNPTLALEEYKIAVELDSSYVIARVRLAELLIKNGNASAARMQLEEAIRWNPNSVEAREALNKLSLK